MDFFEHQDQAHRNTSRLIFLFGFAIALMILAFYLVALVVFHEEMTPFRVVRPGLFLLVAAATLGIIGFGSLTKMVELQRGGPAVAESLGGKQIRPQTEDFKEQQLLNVVTEMALASGTPVPTVYVLDGESGINAFAAGYSPDDAVIGVTRGCLDQLTREELQGVIAHEFSHILNGDMRLNLKLMGVVQGLLFIYILGRIFADGSGRSRHSRSNKDGGGKGALIGFSMVMIGAIGLFCGRLIKSGVSRQREFLADASAVQFTRNPHGIAGALRRIGGYSSGSRLQSPRAEEASHMFFGSALNSPFFGDMMATHPPLSDRIRRITGLKVEPLPATAAAGLSEASVMGFRGATPIGKEAASRASARPAAAIPHQASEFMATVGTATPQHLAKAHTFLESLPSALRDAVQSPEGAMALVYGILLDRQPAVRSRQLAIFQQPGSSVDAQPVENLAELLRDMDARVYLPLLDLSIPVLRTITPQQCADFFKQIQALVRADGKLSLSEYVLQLILQKRLRPHFQKDLKQPKTVSKLDPLWPDCQTLLTILARIGRSRPEDAFYAFKSGIARLPGAHQRELPQTLPKVTLTDLGQSLKRLEAAVPKLKQSIVDAAAHTVMVDQDVTLKEAELLRAIVITLDCPIPPFLDAAAKATKAKAVAKTASRNGRG